MLGIKSWVFVTRKDQNNSRLLKGYQVRGTKFIIFTSSRRWVPWCLQYTLGWSFNGFVYVNKHLFILYTKCSRYIVAAVDSRKVGGQKTKKIANSENFSFHNDQLFVPFESQKLFHPNDSPARIYTHSVEFFSSVCKDGFLLVWRPSSRRMRFKHLSSQLT